MQSRIITAELVDMVGEDQRMGTLLDIPQIDPEAASAASIANGVPARLIDSLKSETEAGTLSSDTIVGSISPVLMPELEAAGTHKDESAEKAAPSELHQLVVNAEQKKRARGERGALWLLLGVVVMAGGTGWLMRDFQSADPVALSAPVPAAVAKEENVVPEKQEAGEDAEAAAQQRAARQELERKARLEREEIATAKAAAAEKAAQQRAAALSRQAEATARLKKESDRMEREQRAAERRLAKQRAARKELERRARLEREKMAAAKQAAEKLARERPLATTVSSGKAAQEPVPRKPVQTGRAPVSLLESEVPSYDEDDGDAIILDVKARFASENAREVVTSPVRSAATPAEGDGEAIVQTENEGEAEFAANPCNGPTARFLSTCR
ncbi:MAG TPA: hypothetical protein ENI74_00805 [Gammaproteobacteria bacterium]|nr:hypothetical protein [Gammaproteobacteria bacterium]